MRKGLEEAREQAFTLRHKIPKLRKQAAKEREKAKTAPPRAFDLRGRPERRDNDREAVSKRALVKDAMAKGAEKQLARLEQYIDNYDY